MMCAWGFKVEHNDTIYKFRWVTGGEDNSPLSIEEAQKIASELNLGTVTETSSKPYDMKGELYRGEDIHN